MLFAGAGSSKQKNLTSFMNQLRKLNPSMTRPRRPRPLIPLHLVRLQALQRFGSQVGHLVKVLLIQRLWD